jgi:hypothetical protein
LPRVWATENLLYTVILYLYTLGIRIYTLYTGIRSSLYPEGPALLIAAVSNHFESFPCPGSVHEQLLFSWTLFWHFHVAHALIYGVIKTLWIFLLREPGQATAAGEQAARIIILNEVRKELARRLRKDSFK